MNKESHIRSKLKAEGVDFFDTKNAIKILKRCVLGAVLVKAYKELIK